MEGAALGAGRIDPEVIREGTDVAGRPAGVQVRCEHPNGDGGDPRG